MAFSYPFTSTYNGGAPADFDEFDSTLNEMSMAELEALLNDQEALKKMAKNSYSVKKCFEEKEVIMKENGALAEANLAFEPEVFCAKRELSSAYDSFNEVQSRYQDLVSQIESLNNSSSPSSIFPLLQAATAVVEERSDNLTHQFLEGNIDVDVFLKEFIPLRKLYNERHFKTEKLKEQLSSGGTVNTFRPPVTRDPITASDANENRVPYPSLRDGTY